MGANGLRWLVKNLGTLLLAFVLAVVVWVSAVISTDPNEEGVLALPVPIRIIGQDASYQIMGSYDTQVSLTLKAPRSIWDQLNSGENAVNAWVDLSGLGPGEHTIPVQVQIEKPGLVRQISQEPTDLTLELEPLVTEVFSLTLVVNGDLPTGYTAAPPIIDPAEVTVSGPLSVVSRVSEMRVSMDIAGESMTVTKTTTPIPIDANNRIVTGLTVTPDIVNITQPINLLGGFRYVIVKAVSEGQWAPGYKLTNILVTPVGVVVFSSDPQLVEDLPGYIETKPIDLTDADDDFEVLIELDLPENISVVGDAKVLVQVSIGAIESSLPVSLPVEVVGLAPGLEVAIAPFTVDVILAGPVRVLDDLELTDLRVKVDVTEYDVGTYQIIPVVDLLPERVEVISILPPTVEVIITLLPTPTPTPTLTPTLTPTPDTTGTPDVSGPPTPTPSVQP